MPGIGRQKKALCSCISTKRTGKYGLLATGLDFIQYKPVQPAKSYQFIFLSVISFYETNPAAFAISPSANTYPNTIIISVNKGLWSYSEFIR